MARFSKVAIFLVVALRLATGWHFYSEGVKKLEPGFSSAGVLRAATGPLAPLYHGMVTGPHGTFAILSEPQKEGTLSAEQAAELAKWQAEYAKAVVPAIKNGDLLPTEVSPHASYAAVLENLRKSWDQGLQRLGNHGVSDEQLAEAKQIQERELGDLLYYFYTEGPAIDELRHEAWRLEQLREEAIGKKPAPFLHDRIKKKSAEVWKTMRPWGAAVTQSEESYIAAVTEVVTTDAEDAPTASRVESALAERAFLKRIDMIVTVVVMACGIGLFLGLFTPFFAVVAALFLISIIATQPPWVADANTTYFFYQLVEVVALLLLAAVSAGRWAGLDRLIFGAPPVIEETPWT